jgi:hypothetical protein
MARTGGPQAGHLDKDLAGRWVATGRLAYEPIGSDGLDAILRPMPSAITTPPGPHRHTASTVRAAHAALRVPPEDVLPGRRGIAISVCPTPLGTVLKAAFDDLNDAVRRGSHRFSSFFRAIYSISYRAHRLRLIQRYNATEAYRR